MATILLNDGKHMSAEERDATGKPVKPAVLYFAGQTMVVQEAEAVTLRKDTKRFTDKGP